MRDALAGCIVLVGVSFIALGFMVVVVAGAVKSPERRIV